MGAWAKAAGGHSSEMKSNLLLICHQNAPMGIVFTINLKDGNDYPFPGGLSLFGNGVGDAFHHLAFLLNGAAFVYGALNVGHAGLLAAGYWLLARSEEHTSELSSPH